MDEDTFKKFTANPNVDNHKHIPTKNDEYDIESLDPDKRSWYYDGDGNKRKKE